MGTAAAVSRQHQDSAVLLFFIGLTIAAIIGQTWWVIVQDRQLTIESEKANGLVTVRILEEHATQTLQDAARKIDAVVTALHASNRDMLADEVAIREIIARSLQDIRYLKAIQFINLKGESWVTSTDFPTHQANVSDRQYVQYLITHPKEPGMLIGHPFASRYDSQLVIPVARNLYDSLGRHVGIISTDIRISYFGNVYARVAKDNNATVSLVADQGFVIVRSPFEARYVDRDLSQSPILARLRSGPTESSFEDDSFLDDELPRLYTYRKIAGFPIMTVYGRDFDSILIAWRNRTEDRILFSSAIIAFICVLAYFLRLHIRRLHLSEQSLRDSEFKFASIFQRSPVPLALIRLNNDQFTEVNDVLLSQFGFSRGEVIGRTSVELNSWVNPADRQPFIEQLRRQQYVDRLEVKLRHKDGHMMICLLSGRVFDSVEQKMFIFSPLDITRQREIENEIREFNTQLEQRVRVRTLKLEHANSELADALTSLKNMQDELIRSEKMAALGSLVAGIAHELNTPIGTSVTVASTLLEQTKEMLDEVRFGNLRRSSFDQFLTNAANGSELLLRTLDRASELVSSFKQVAVDQSSNQRRTFNLEHVLGEVIATLEPLYKKTPYKLKLDLAPDIELNAYPGPLGQVLTNFVTNSLSHGFDGRDHGTMNLTTRLIDADHVEMIFSDNGVGIPEANRKRVFDPFFTTKLGQGGSGLGMNIVYNLVTGVLGGKIALDSTVGVGTTLTLVLPRCAPGN